MHARARWARMCESRASSLGRSGRVREDAVEGSRFRLRPIPALPDRSSRCARRGSVVQSRMSDVASPSRRPIAGAEDDTPAATTRIERRYLIGTLDLGIECRRPPCQPPPDPCCDGDGLRGRGRHRRHPDPRRFRRHGPAHRARRPARGRAAATSLRECPRRPSRQFPRRDGAGRTAHRGGRTGRLPVGPAPASMRLGRPPPPRRSGDRRACPHRARPRIA